MRRIPLIFAVAVLLCAASAAPALAGPANGQPGSSPTGGDPVSAYLASLPAGYQDNQLALMDFNTRLNSLPGVEQAGYVGSVDDLATRSATVYWYGASAVPATVTALISSATVHAAVATWPFSRAQIEAASRKLLASGKAHGIPGFSVEAVAGFDPAYQGLELEGSYATGGAARTAASVEQSATSVAGLPVKVVTGMSGGPADGDRDRDYAPFYAGGLMYSAGSGGFCASGSPCATPAPTTSPRPGTAGRTTTRPRTAPARSTDPPPRGRTPDRAG